MKKLIIIGIILVGYLFQGFTPPSRQVHQVYCELHGSVFIAEFPGQADFLVYEEDSEAFADMLVFETDNSLFADRNGIWYFTEQAAFADFSVYFVDIESQADFTIYFTDFESFAGCNQ